MKICSRCGNEKSIDDYPTRKRGLKIYKAAECKWCRNQRTGNYKKSLRAALKPTRIILEDTRREDRVNHRINDLTYDFVNELIKDGCSYCGDSSIRMTVDRIDNTLGHLQNNVRAACIRCNLIKRDMPFEAWLVIVPGIRLAREQGLFNQWKCLNRKIK